MRNRQADLIYSLLCLRTIAYFYKFIQRFESSSRIYEFGGKRNAVFQVLGFFAYIESSNEYVAENKVMPASVDSATGQRDNIVVTILEDGAACLSVDTETQAQRGAQINVVIRPTKMEAIITVGSWQIRKAVTVL